ncbi:hypothetical protein MAR_014334, partial [Mya arenaria]
MARLEKQQEDIKLRQDKTDERSIDTQWRTMRENLIFSGIPEINHATFKERGEDCEQTIQNIIKNDMNVEREILFDRVHRLGKYNRNHQYPRPIIAKFTFYKDREYIRQTAHSSLGGTDYYVKEQFPPEIESERKLLYGPAREARENKENKVRLVKDKLYINGQRYAPKERPNNPLNRQNEQFRSDNNSFQRTARWSSNVNREERTRWSRTFTRSQPTSGWRNAENTIPLRNAFAALGTETQKGIETPRQSHAGKKKATSPLENVDTFKKYKENGSHSDSEENVESTVLIDLVVDSQTDTQPPLEGQGEQSNEPSASAETSSDEEAEIVQNFDICDIPITRKCIDQNVNNYGNQMIEFCKNNNTFILNGRINPDYDNPKLTCKNTSTVDYFISTSDVFQNVIELKILDFCSLLSDVHCPVELKLKSKYTNSPDTQTKANKDSTTKIKYWDQEKSELFSNNIDLTKVAEMEMKLDNLGTIHNIDQTSVNNITDDIAHLYTDCSK